MIKRRQLIRYAGAGLLTALGTTLTSNKFQVSQAQTTSNSLSIQWLGHTSFLFTGDGKRILTNPFRAIGCTAGYRAPKAAADVVLISSYLLDEGFVDGIASDTRILYQPGVYQLQGTQFQGISTHHDRVGGRRFGTNVAWRWKQNGIDILHLGGIAGPIEVEQQILMGRPDVVLIPVGGGPKAYTAQEAVQALRTLNPRMVIPTHYRTQAADPNACDIVALDEFLSLMGGASVRRSNSDAIALNSANLPQQGPVVQVLSYKF